MLGVNKVMILGRLGQDPDVRMTPNGQHVCTLNVATKDTWMKDGQKEERTEWHRCVLWGRQAELAGKYLKKGRSVFIEGRLQTRSWDDQNGQKRYSTEIVANQIQFIDGASSSRGDSPSDSAEMGDNGYATAPSYDSPAARNTGTTGGGFKPSDLDDDVPF